MAHRASKMKWNGNYLFGNDVLINKPEFGALVAAAIAGWAMTEARLGRAFAHLIGAKQPITMSMYEVVRSFEVRRDLLTTAAAEVLPKRYALLFSAALSVLTRAASDRHNFAHWIWGCSADPELDALFLVEPKQFWRLTVTQVRYWKYERGKKTIGKVGPWQFTANSPKLDGEHIHVYRLKELQETRERIERAYWIANALSELAAANTARRRVIYQRLCAEADIQTALEKEKKKAPQRKRSVRPLPPP